MGVTLIYVCVQYVCRWAPMYVAIYVCMRICVYMYMYACLHVCIYPCMYAMQALSLFKPSSGIGQLEMGQGAIIVSGASLTREIEVHALLARAGAA